MKRPEFSVFLTIVFAQFCGTSLWFAGNAVVVSSIAHEQVVSTAWLLSAKSYITIAVQSGFIIGTLLFSLSGIVDRYSPSKVFCISCIAGAICNIILLIEPASFSLSVVTRVAVGICLAGIYPVGMKVASDWTDNGLGNWLGALVGALVLGTALPHGINVFTHSQSSGLLVVVSALAVAGGVMMLKFVPDGPFRKQNPSFSFSGVKEAFSIESFRRPALGYFGHMWEVYAFWAFVPSAIWYYAGVHADFMFETSVIVNQSTLAFAIIAAGAIGCWLGGKISAIAGSEKIAFYMLLASGICCMLSPWVWYAPPYLFVVFMIVWGFTAAADSPQFSALIARAAPEKIRGSAITMITCIGFSITIISIQLVNVLQERLHDYYLFVLLPGPVFGLIAMTKMIRRR